MQRWTGGALKAGGSVGSSVLRLSRALAHQVAGSSSARSRCRSLRAPPSEHAADPQGQGRAQEPREARRQPAAPVSGADLASGSAAAPLAHHVLVDQGMILRVLHNLLINASHAMEGVGRIDLACAAEGPHVVMTLRDQGPGVPSWRSVPRKMSSVSPSRIPDPGHSQ